MPGAIQYAHSDPVNKADPSGNFFIIIDVVITIYPNLNVRGQNAVVAGGQVYRANAALRRLATGSVRELKQARRSARGIWKDARGSGEEIHHIIEQRLLNDSSQLRKIFSHADDITGRVLSSAEHRMYTNAWLKEFPRKNMTNYIQNPTIDKIISASYRIYDKDPFMLRQILLKLY